MAIHAEGSGLESEIEIRLAGREDLPALTAAGDDIFDFAVKPARAEEFLDDPRHHLAVALHGTRIVGMASAVHYVHPDKDPELFIAEVGVSERYWNRGIARRLVRRLCEHAAALGCTGAWVATEEVNLPARRAYAGAGGREDEQRVVLIEFEVPGTAAVEG